MANAKEKDVDSGVGTDFTKFRIRTKLLSTCSGAGVNADSSVNLAFARADPLSELVWLPQSGLSLKCANPGADVRKPFLMWNVGPSTTEPRGGGDDHDMIIDKATLVPSHGDGSAKSDRKMKEEGEDEREADLCHPQTVQTDESRKEVAVSEVPIYLFPACKEASSAVVPAALLKKPESSAENDGCGLGGAELPAEGSCMGSRRRGKALSDGDIYKRSSDDSAESRNSAGQSSKGMKGVKRKVCDEDEILGSKKMRKLIHGSDGSTFVTKTDTSFMKWISNMTRSDPNREDSVSPVPLACANDVNFVCFKPRDPAAASTSMGFQAVFQSLYYRETVELSGGGKKIVESIEVPTEGAAVDDDGKSPENLHEHTLPIIVGSPSANGVVQADAVCDETKIAAKEVCPETAVASPSKARTSLWITRLSTNTLRSEKGKERAEETSNLDSQANAVSAMIDCEAAFEVKPVSKVQPSMDSLRHNLQRCLSCGGWQEVTKEDVLLKLSRFDDCSRHWGSSGRCERPLKEMKSEMLDAIRKLRLSRADILRWMKSEGPVSQLNGFFLRLRLAGEGGTYYVGCITAAAAAAGTSRKSITVDVGGMKSCVATQYVSNHDFLEDEIKAWWSRTLATGCRIPSLAHLNSNFNHPPTFPF